MTIFRIDTQALVDQAQKKATQALLKEIGSQIRGLEPRLKASTLKASRLHAGVATALKTTDAKALGTLASACAGEIGAFRGYQGELVDIERKLGVVQKDSEFVDQHLPRLMPLTKGLANEKLDCTAYLEQLEKDRQLAEAAAAVAARRAVALAKAKADLDTAARNYAAVLENLVQGLDGLAAKIEKAAKAGDRKAFDAAAADIETLVRNQKTSCDFIAKGRAKVLGDARAQFGSQLDGLPSVRRLDQLDADVARVRQAAAKAAAKAKDTAAPVDAKRAAKVLGLEKFEADLAKVLNGPAGGHEKGLEAVAKRGGQNQSTGRQLLAMLIKARVL